MKTLKITTDNKISVVGVNFSDFKAIQQAIGGYFEIVKTQKLRDYFKASVVMIVDEGKSLERSSGKADCNLLT